MKTKDRVTPKELLNQKAEQLAQRHRRRLDEMTEMALENSLQNRFNWLRPQPVLALATFAVVVSTYSLFSTTEHSLPPSAHHSANQVAALPDWVMDDQVPLALLESPEFYDWLAKQMPIQEVQEG
ncbi:MAG TPA: hypothetical protein ENJ07_00870 [Gammaproteobacteria bacterium]|nr:hypothetical protein [Gammaproteobacteria bacterium]